MVMNRVSLSRAKKILRIPEPDAMFDIYPEGKRGLFFRCLIFRTTKQMRAGLRFKGHKSAYNVNACLMGTRAGEESLRICGDPRCIGLLFFCRCTDNTTAHEIWHATNWWGRQMRFQARTCVTAGHATHERLACAHGKLVGEFRKKWWYR